MMKFRIFLAAAFAAALLSVIGVAIAVADLVLVDEEKPTLTTLPTADLTPQLGEPIGFSEGCPVQGIPQDTTEQTLYYHEISEEDYRLVIVCTPKVEPGPPQ